MLRDIRKQYHFSALLEEDVNSNPLLQFDTWLHEAVESDQLEPTAMILSTSDAQQQPHSRVVLLKERIDEGFVFYTNYEGNKAQQIAINPTVSLLFFWPSLERQVRVEGRVEKMSEVASTDYFLSRPLDSQLGAWASPQSKQIPSAAYLETQFSYFQQKFGNSVSKPLHWGGYVVKPTLIEFWQGRPNRLHDRLQYTLENEKWNLARLAP